MDFKTLVENSTQGVCVIQDNKIVYANNAFSKMFGYTSASILEKCPAIDLISTTDKNHGSDLKTQGKIDFVGTMATNGIRKHFRSHIDKIEWNGSPAIQMSARDISDDIARDIERKDILQSVNDNIRVGLWQANTEGVFTYVNEYFCKVFEQQADDIVGRHVKNLIAVVDLKCEDGRKQSTEAEITLDDGIQKWIKVTCNFMHDGYVGTVADITTSKVYLPELIKLRDDIKREKIR